MNKRAYQFVEIVIYFAIIVCISFSLYKQYSEKKAMLLRSSALDASISQTISIIGEKNENLMLQLRKMCNCMPIFAKVQWASAIECSRISDELNVYIERHKNNIIRENMGINDTSHMNFYLKMERNWWRNYKVKSGSINIADLNKMFLDSRKQYLEILENVRKADTSFHIEKIFPGATKTDVSNSDIISENFDGILSFTAINLLTKLQVENRSLQAKTLKELLNRLGADEVIWKNMAVWVSDKTTVYIGEKFKARVFLVRYDPKSRVNIYINGKWYKAIDGIASYEEIVKSKGSHIVPIVIEVCNLKSGETKVYMSKMNYEVL